MMMGVKCKTCVNEDVFFEIRILIEFLGTEMAAEGADSRMNQAMRCQRAGAPELLAALGALIFCKNR